MPLQGACICFPLLPGAMPPDQIKLDFQPKTALKVQVPLTQRDALG
jgi:hypothetical protein